MISQLDSVGYFSNPRSASRNWPGPMSRRENKHSGSFNESPAFGSSIGSVDRADAFDLAPGGHAGEN